MNERSERRSEQGLTQSDAAASAGVSLATWRRWEENPDSVRLKTRVACEKVLATTTAHERAMLKSAEAFQSAWAESQVLSPRQAYAIAATLSGWGDMNIGVWLEDRDEPLHCVSPFDLFELRIMMYLGESAAFAEAVRRRCYALADEIEHGVLPFDRPGAFIDEVLVGATLEHAPALLADEPYLFDLIPERATLDDEENDVYLFGDDEWGAVSDEFDERCRWDNWEVPIWTGHPLLPLVLERQHPFTWFDYPSASTFGLRVEPSAEV